MTPRHYFRQHRTSRPNTLIFADNVRDTPQLAEPFVTSVREHGVLQPITAQRCPDTAEVTVLDGQLRTLAARAAGLHTIPVYVHTAVTQNAKVQRAARIPQIVTNDQRSALTDAQRARGKRLHP